MPEFDDIKDQIQFSGFTEAQEETILNDLERVYGTESGQAMMDAGLAGEGLHYLNTNSQAVLQEFATATQEDPRFQNSTASDLHGGNFAVTDSAHPRTLSGGRVYVNAYDSIDPATGDPEVYTDPTFAGKSSVAADADPIYSLDHDGEVFEIDPFYILVHETNHTARDERDITGNNPAAGEYYTPSMIGGTRDSVIDAYEGINESNTQVIMEELGIDQLRGSYLGTSLEGRAPGEDYGLGRDHDVAITTNQFVDMTNHTPVDGVVLDGITQDTLNRFNAPGRTDLLDQEFRVGNGNDTVHAFDGDDIVRTGGGDDRIFLGSGNDVAHAGWGMNTIDGGDANLDPTSDHKSDTTMDWGFDRVDYTTLDAGFAPADGLSADGTARDGVLMTIDADTISVNKGQHFSPMIRDDVDQLHNIDTVRGTARDDLTQVNGLSGERMVDGGDGVDTLRVPEDVTNNTTAGTFNGQAYDGYLEAADGAKLYYTNYENIDVATSPTTEQEALNETEGPTQTIPMEEALKLLRDEGTSLEADAGPTGDALRTPGARAIMQTLVENDQTELEVSTEAMNGTAGDQVAEVLRAATNAVEERGLTEQAEETYEHMVEAHEAVHEHQAETEQSRVNDEQVSYDMAM